MLNLRPDLKKIFPGPDPEVFDQIMNLQGEAYRDLAGRRTIRVVLDGHGYFAKLHYGVGWKEIIKNLMRLSLPVVGARTEWLAIQRFAELGVATMSIAGFGERGLDPAGRQSFLITDELADTISLEDLILNKNAYPISIVMKRRLIRKVAQIARDMHQNGVNHRDFYLCHFLLPIKWLKQQNSDLEPPLYVIDLHRTQLRSVVPQRWLEKDLVGLHFSSMDADLTRRDRLRFVSCYEGVPVRRVIEDLSGFWSKIDRKSIKLHKKFHKRYS